VKWLELSIRTTPEYVEPISELFRRYGDRGAVVQQEGDWDPDTTIADLRPPTSVVVSTYVPLDATARNRQAMIDVGIRLISILNPMEPLQERILDEQEWETAWRSHFTLLRIGTRLVIKPTWQEYLPNSREKVMELDPGMAFGTGHHPTTRMCLEELERRVSDGMRVLDMGTGSGILAVAASKLGAQSVVAMDIDTIAVRMARANLRHNGITQMVKVIHGTLPHPQVSNKRFELVTANIIARTIIEKTRLLTDVLAPGGVLVASGILQDQQNEVEKAFHRTPLVILDIRQQDDWVAVLARRSG